MALAVLRLVVSTRVMPVGRGWNDSGLSCLSQQLEHAVLGFRDLVGDDRVRFDIWQPNVRALLVMGLSEY